MANRSYTSYKGNSGRGVKMKATAKGNGKKRVAIRTRGRTRVKVA